MTTTTKEEGYSRDAERLLQYDPALVVFGQLHNRDVLNQLSDFASKLTRYVEIATKECQERPGDTDTQRNDAMDADLLPTANVEQEEDVEKTEGLEVGPPMAASVSADSLKVASKSCSKKDETNRASSDSSESESDTAGTLTSRREEEVTAAEEPAPKRQRVEEVSTTFQLPAAISTEDIVLPPDGYKGTLRESQLKRSVGLTRAALNQHIKELGLTTKFGQGAISKTGNIVSHVTLSPKYQYLPYSSHEKLQMWLGVGKNRWKFAIPLSPKSSDPPQHHPAIPIFWAAKPHGKGTGAHLCHYVGNFRCVKFEKWDEIQLKMDSPRQALLEFKFVSFDQNIAIKMAKISAQTRN